MPSGDIQHLELKRKRIKKVKLKDVERNPFRSSFDLYPLQEEKIAKLVESMRETGDWENLLGRTKGEKVEIAYGHHRIEAARRLFSLDHEVEIRIRDLSDEDMIKIMARENSQEYRRSIAAIDDAVRAAEAHLRANPERAKQLLPSGAPECLRLYVGAPMIATFLGMSEDSAEKSIERLNLIKSGVVDRDALYMMPSTRSADAFAAAIKEFGIKKESQKEIAAKLVSEKLFSQKSMLKAVASFLPKSERLVVQRNGEEHMLANIRLMEGLVDSLGELREQVSKESAISLDTAREFGKSACQLEAAIGETTNLIDESTKSKPLTLSAFKRIIRLLLPSIAADRLEGLYPGLLLDSEANLLIAARNEGGMFYSLENPIVTKSLLKR